MPTGRSPRPVVALLAMLPAASAAASGGAVGSPSVASAGTFFSTPLGVPDLSTLARGDPSSLFYRERFLAASGNTNRLTLAEAISARLVDGPVTFAGIDRRRRGIITLEDVRRFVR